MREGGVRCLDGMSEDKLFAGLCVQLLFVPPPGIFVKAFACFGAR